MPPPLFCNPILTVKEMFNNPFPYSSDNKRYHSLNYYLTQKYGKRVMKASLDGGFTCPNIDGSKGIGGCTYCTSGASEFTLFGSITAQLEAERARISKKYGDVPLIAYFQSHTSTYAPLEILKAKFKEALSFPSVCALSISTRADCLEKEKIEYLKELSQGTDLTVELGLQTINDAVARKCNRQHSYAEFLKAFTCLKEANIRVCVHIINGLYGETKEDMVKTAKAVGLLEPDGVKIHLLHIMKNTKMAQEYKNGEIVPMTFEDYVETVCNQLRVLPLSCVIERITGDGSKENLVAPRWSTDKIRVLGEIDRFMADNNIFQGDLFEKI